MRRARSWGYAAKARSRRVWVLVCGGSELLEEIRYVQPAIDRLIGHKASLCLGELPLPAHPIVAPRLVPSDRHVNETLEEIALTLGRCPPRILQRLMCREELATFDQGKTPTVVHFHRRVVADAQE